jgi:hypothetical protein
VIDPLSMSIRAMRALFTDDSFTIGELGRDPVLGPYRYVQTSDPTAARAAIVAARAAGYTVHPTTGARVRVSAR